MLWAHSVSLMILVPVNFSDTSIPDNFFDNSIHLSTNVKMTCINETESGEMQVAKLNHA